MYLSAELIRRLKHAAINSDRSVSRFVETAREQRLAELKAQEEQQ